MIDITPDIIGPGIEEEYEDAMVRIRFLQEAFKGCQPSNDTAHGRVVYQLEWLKQQIEARRLPIPVDRSWVATLHYVVGSCEVDDTPEIANALGDLSIIMKGIGLIKSRHIPVLVSTIRDFIDDIHRFADPLTPDEIELTGLLDDTTNGLADGTIVPPVPSRPGPVRNALKQRKRLEHLFHSLPIRVILLAGAHPSQPRFTKHSDPSPHENHHCLHLCLA